MNKNLIGSVIGAFVATAIAFGAVKYSGPSVVADDPAPAPVVVVVDPNQADVVVEASTTIKVGELAIIDVSKSNADSIVWKVKPETKNFKVFDNGRVAVFSSEAEGEYLFFISGAKAGTVDGEIVVITVGKGSVPLPVSVSTKVPTWLAKVASPSKRDEAIRLAQSFSSVASMATSSTPPGDIVAMTVKSNRDALGNSIKAWEPFLLDLQAELEARAAAGALSTADAHVALWREISQALAASAGQPAPTPTTSAKVRGR